MQAEAAGGSWAIATPHTLATQAGAVAFERGGNALDAALWAAVTLAVSYPHMCGVGGDLFALIQHPSGDAIGINASGRAPAATVPAAIPRTGGGTRMPERGPAPITVPGAVSGWRTLHDQGARLPWADAFAQAIALAHGGVAVSPSLRATLLEEPQLASDPGLEIFFPSGEPLPEGDLFRQPALAVTLQRLAAQGPGALYGGEVGAALVAGLNESGVPMTLDDLARHRADLVSPLRGRYRELDVLVCPPNSQGFVLLEVLAALERLGSDPDPLGSEAGILARIFDAAAFDRDRHLADPDAMRIHPSTLLDDGHMGSLVEEVRTGRRREHHAGTEHPRGDTIALVAADGDGSAVSLIQSLFYGFGAGMLEPQTGIVMQNRGACFTLEPDHPNVIAPGKRPLHTLMPVLVQQDGRLTATAGSMGGYAQPQINAMNLIRVFDLGRSPAEAIAQPRWLVNGMDPDDGKPWVAVESDVPVQVHDSLREAGYRVETIAAHDEEAGHAHMIRLTPGGLIAGSDPRADGGALAG